MHQIIINMKMTDLPVNAIQFSITAFVRHDKFPINKKLFKARINE